MQEEDTLNEESRTHKGQWTRRISYCNSYPLLHNKLVPNSSDLKYWIFIILQFLLMENLKVAQLDGSSIQSLIRHYSKTVAKPVVLFCMMVGIKRITARRREWEQGIEKSLVPGCFCLTNLKNELAQSYGIHLRTQNIPSPCSSKNNGLQGPISHPPNPDTGCERVGQVCAQMPGDESLIPHSRKG